MPKAFEALGAGGVFACGMPLPSRPQSKARTSRPCRPRLMRIALFLQCDAAFLVISVAAVLLRRRSAVAAIVYCGSLVLSVALLAGALGRLIAGASPDGVVLPIGLPWVGSHFRLDALSAFFLVVINLGAAAASLYGARLTADTSRTSSACCRSFRRSSAGMNLVLLADDAFTFLASWEFMSLASWALVMARHQEADNARAGYVYIVMASFGTMALLLAFGTAGGTARRLRVRHDARERRRRPGVAASCARSRAHRRGIEGGTGSAPRLAAARAPGRAEPRLRI